VSKSDARGERNPATVAKKPFFAPIKAKMARISMRTTDNTMDIFVFSL
jgi:hypothetical protein